VHPVFVITPSSAGRSRNLAPPHTAYLVVSFSDVFLKLCLAGWKNNDVVKTTNGFVILLYDKNRLCMEYWEFLALSALRQAAISWAISWATGTAESSHFQKPKTVHAEAKVPVPHWYTQHDISVTCPSKDLAVAGIPSMRCMQQRASTCISLLVVIGVMSRYPSNMGIWGHYLHQWWLAVCLLRETTGEELEKELKALDFALTHCINDDTSFLLETRDILNIVYYILIEY